jgi:hypothetical protein
MELVRDRLTAAKERGVLRVEILHGVGGVGKSTLARALCHETRITDSFDGVLWAELGPTANSLEALTRFVALLGEPGFRPSSLHDASDRLRIRLNGKRLLVVLDDVWHANDAQPFMVDPNSVILITTRRANVAEDLRARIIEIPPFTSDEAMSLLARWMGRDIRPDEFVAADQLAASLERLPLALELAGSLLSRGVPWSVARAAFEAETEQLLKKGSRMTRQLAKVLACIRISVRELQKENPAVWDRFGRLGILARGALVTPQVAAVLWQTTRSDATDTLQELQSDALVRHTGGEVWQLHGMVQDAAVGTLTDRPPEGIGLSLESAHSAFLRDIGWSGSALAHSSFADDGYTYKHLTWHLEMAGEIAAIHKLMTEANEDGSCQWWSVLNAHEEASTFLSDLDRASRLALLEQNPFPLGYRYALIRSSMATTAQCIAPIVLGSLVETGAWDLHRALAVAKQVKDPRRAAEMFVKLTEIASKPHQHALFATLFECAVEGIEKIREREVAAELAARLARVSSGKLRGMLCKIVIESMGKEASRQNHWLRHYVKVLALLPSESYEEALTVVLNQTTDPDDAYKFALELARQAAELHGEESAGWVSALLKWCEYWIHKTVGTESAELKVSASHVPAGPRAEPTPAASSPGASGKVNAPSTALAATQKPSGERIDALASEPKAPAKVGSAGIRNGVEDVLMLLLHDGLLDSAYASARVRLPKYKSEINAIETTDSQTRLINRIDELSGLALPSTRISLIAKLLNQVPDSHRKQVIDQAAAAIKELWNGYHYIWENDGDPVAALNTLGDFIPESARLEIIENLKQAASRTSYYDCGWRLARLASLVPSNASILSDAEDRFLSGSPGPMRDRAVAALIEVVDRKRVPQLLSEYQRIGDEEELARLRFAVAPYLGVDAALSDIAKEGKTKRLRSLARMMEELVSTLNESQLRHFVTAATELVADWWVVEALSDVLLKVDNGLAVSRILNAAVEIGPPDLRSRLAIRAVQRLAQLGYVDGALATAVRVELDAERWRGLSDTAEALAAARRFSEAIAVAAAIVNREERGRAQALISLHQARHGFVDQASLLAEQIDSENWREWTRAHLSRAIDRTLVSVPRESSSVAGSSTDSQEEDSCAKVLRDRSGHPAWSALGTYVSKSTRPLNLADFWREPIANTAQHFLSYFDTELRADFLREMRDLVPVLARFSTREDLIAIDRVTKAVGHWWR